MEPSSLPIELYQEIMVTHTFSDALHVFTNLRTTHKDLRNVLDTNTQAIINAIAKKFEIEPLLVALSLPSQLAQAYAQELLKTAKARYGNKFSKYLSDLLEQLLRRKMVKQQWEKIVCVLLDHGAYFRKRGVYLHGNRWLSGSRVYQLKTNRNVRRRSLTAVDEIKEFPDYYTKNADLPHKDAVSMKLNEALFLHAALLFDQFMSPRLFKIGIFDLNLKQHGTTQTLDASFIPRQATLLAVYKLFDSPGYLIAFEAYEGLPGKLQTRAIELWFAKENSKPLRIASFSNATFKTFLDPKAYDEE